MILVAGATGYNGGEIVRQLRAADQPVRAIVGGPDQDDALAKLGATVVRADLAQPASLLAAFDGADRAVLVPANTEDQVVLEGNFIAAAKHASVRHLVKFSAAGASPDSEARILRWHGESERLLQESGLPWTIVRPVWFMQNLLPLAASIKEHGVIALPMGQGSVAALDIRDIAASIARTVTEAGHEGRTYIVTGPESISFAAIAEQVSGVAGRRVSYEALSDNAFRQQLVGFGQPGWFAEALVELFRPIRRGEQAAVTSAVAELTGRPPGALSTFLSDYASTFAA